MILIYLKNRCYDVRIKVVSDFHLVEFEEFIILKNISKRTIKSIP